MNNKNSNDRGLIGNSVKFLETVGEITSQYPRTRDYTLTIASLLFLAAGNEVMDFSMLRGASVFTAGILLFAANIYIQTLGEEIGTRSDYKNSKKIVPPKI